MAQKLRLSDYKQPNYWTKKTDLTFEIEESHVIVSCSLQLEKNSQQYANDIILQGGGQEILTLSIDGKQVSPSTYLKGKNLEITLSGQAIHQIYIQTKIHPNENKSFEGLYCSNNKYFTQCEAEGFRNITYYQDHPDVLSLFTTTIIAAGYPVLLSNGNLIQQETIGNKTKVVWEDPFPKPSYLFALVAGDFDKISDHFTTRSNRKILLEVYVDKGMSSRATHAMKSLKESMKWDEERYDLEYDLDRFMIVAANDFNFGAMENKGLNIFNAKYVLADSKTATDMDFYNIQSVVGHEYFHNWTGNRVTCRDWFQLSLKEGLTVYRDQEFSSDLNSRGVKRIDDVIRLRQYQFSEDAGGNSHPVRPTEAFNISNFYTATIYEKGAEVIRMIETLIGREKFKKGIAKYFELYDGQAVTTEDFCHAMSVASGKDLTYFQRWYSQKGTPRLEVKKTEKQERLHLEFQQITSPLLLPIAIAFINKEGKQVEDVDVIESTFSLQKMKDHYLFEITKENESISLDIPFDTRISLLRDFSAPIILKYNASEEELLDLATYDTNSFAKWEALQQLITKDLLKNINSLLQKRTLSFSKNIVTIYQKILTDPISDPAYTAKLFAIPAVDNLKLEFATNYPLDEIFTVLLEFKKYIIATLQKEIIAVYNQFKDTDSSAARSLKNTLLQFMCLNSENTPIAENQYLNAINMTDQISALDALKNSKSMNFKNLMQDFYSKWSKDALVYTKYLSTLFTRMDDSLFKEIVTLHSDPAFQNWNPNHNYSSYGALALQNPSMFHHISGEAYRILARRILELDEKNPYVAARLANCYNDYKKLDAKRKTLMKVELEWLFNKKLSSNTFEIINNALN